MRIAVFKSNHVLPLNLNMSTTKSSISKGNCISKSGTCGVCVINLCGVIPWREHLVLNKEHQVKLYQNSYDCPPNKRKICNKLYANLSYIMRTHIHITHPRYTGIRYLQQIHKDQHGWWL